MPVRPRQVMLDDETWERYRKAAFEQKTSISALIRTKLTSSSVAMEAGTYTSYRVDTDTGAVATQTIAVTEVPQLMGKPTSTTFLPAGVSRGFGASKAVPKPGGKK